MHNVLHRVHCYVERILLHTCAVNRPWLNAQQLVYKSVCVYEMQRATVGDFHKTRHCCRTVAAHWRARDIALPSQGRSAVNPNSRQTSPNSLMSSSAPNL